MQKTLIYIDTRTKSQVRITGTAANTSDYVTIERGQWQILCVQFVERLVDSAGIVTIIPATFNTGSSFLLVGDNDFSDDNSLMFKSYQSSVPFDTANPETNRFNIEGDWIGGELVDGEWVENDSATADITKGQMSIRINADTQKFIEALGTKERVTNNLYINIKQYISGIDNPSTIAWFKFIATNTVRDWNEATEQVPEGTSIVPFVNSALANPIKLQFSVDGTSWHDVQNVGVDTYYRFRIANVSTNWSSAVQIVNGAPIAYEFSIDGSEWYPADQITEEVFGENYALVISLLTYIRFSTSTGWTPALRFRGNDAGFGDAVATAESIAVDAPPSVSIATEGDDMSKIFRFNFKIPKGKDGDTPEKGVDYYTDADKEELLTELKTYVDSSIANGEW